MVAAMRPPRPSLLALLCATLGIAGAAALVVARTDGHRPRHARPVAPPQEEEQPALDTVSTATGPQAPPPPTTTTITPAARPAPPPIEDRAATLANALTWTDDAARIEAVESAITAGAVETLPVLERVELPRDPEAAPTIIHAVAVLGHEARGGEQARAAGVLGAWLGEESQREGADARGNVSVIVDALGDLGGPDAVSALGAALDRGALPLYVQTLAVQRLVALGDPGAQPAIAGYAARVAALPPADGIDESLREEALAVAAAGQP
jgi:hypothetical protein